MLQGPNKRKRRAREQARKEREEAETAQLRAEAAARPGSTAAVLAAHAAALAQDSSARLDPKAIGTDLLRALRLEEMAQRRPEGVPEFHAGSILRVTYRNSASDRRPRSFVGLCVAKSSRMLGSSFTLRNVVEGTPVEVRFDTYAPWLENIEVLNLARRRRAKLFYLRNRPDKACFFLFVCFQQHVLSTCSWLCPCSKHRVAAERIHRHDGSPLLTPPLIFDRLDTQESFVSQSYEAVPRKDQRRVPVVKSK